MQQEPVLEKPGAGLPFYERLVIQLYYVGLKYPRMKWETAVADFEAQTARIVQRLEPLTTEQAATRILVKRIPGIEDSSRFWSPAMVAEHLVIVATGMSQVIILLSQGRISP